MSQNLEHEFKLLKRPPGLLIRMFSTIPDNFWGQDYDIQSFPPVIYLGAATLIIDYTRGRGKLRFSEYNLDKVALNFFL